MQVNSPFWVEISNQATQDAYNAIVRGLTARGFGSVSQVPLWDDGAGMQKSIGTFLALEAGGALGAFSDTFILKLDRREELKTIQVTINGVWANPDGTGGSPLEIGTGQVQATPAQWPQETIPPRNNIHLPNRW